LATLAEAAVILTPHIPPYYIPPIISTILPKLGSPNTTNLTAASAFGSFMFVMAGYIRWQCYRTLGRFFTFELSIRDGHKLVTSGPYSVVRHPSYTGIPICFIGACAMYYAPGSWLRASGVLGLPYVSMVAGTWAALMVTVIVILMVRIPREDEMMARGIGKEWEEWAQRVKYRLIRTRAFISAVFVQLQSYRLSLPELTTCINHRM
jgi:protein-S-isoprenylcysteine O-methyltransferase Ste14